MHPEQLPALLHPFLADHPLTAHQLDQVQKYLGLLLKWNAKINLTAVRREEDIITRHFGESFFAAQYIFADHPAATAIDFGSGAGFPGLPIAIYSPTTKVTLIESHNKKATFLKEANRLLHLANANVFLGRGEDYPIASHGPADLVTLRAVEKFPQSVLRAAELVAPHGRLALLISQPQIAHAPQSFDWQSPKPVPGSVSRVLLLGTQK